MLVRSRSTGALPLSLKTMKTRLVVFGLYALTIASLATLTWRKWADPQMDLGYSLYNFWQIAEGKTLYRDMMHSYGPAAPLLFGLLFKLFGSSLSVFFSANLALIAIATALIHFILERAFGFIAAVAGALVFLTSFAFAQLITRSGYNFMAPYKEEAVLGTVGLLALVYTLSKQEKSTGTRQIWAILAGSIAGLMALVSSEAFAASLCVLLMGIVLLRSASTTLVLIASSVATVLPAIAAFGAHSALKAVLAPFLYPALAKNPFYAHMSGFDDIAANLASIARPTALAAAAILAVHVTARLWRKWTPNVRPLPPALEASLAASLAMAVFYFDAGFELWLALPKLLPAAVTLITALLIASSVRARKQANARVLAADLFTATLFSVLALAYLGRLFLNPMVQHFGFSMALPATLLMFSVALRATARGTIRRALVIGMVLGFAALSLDRSFQYYALKDFELGQASDRLLVYGPKVNDQAAVLAHLARYLDQRIDRGASVLCLSECSMIHFLARHERASRYSFIHFELLTAGTHEILDDFEKRAPDYVILVHHPREAVVGDAEVPLRSARFQNWLNATYKEVDRIGSPPFVNNHWGAQIFKR